MGRNNKEYAQDLYRQLYERLFGMLENGVDRSKKDDSKNGETDNRIYSYDTYHTYFKHCSYFKESGDDRFLSCNGYRTLMILYIKAKTFFLTC